MRHHYFGKKLSRTKNERQLLLRGLLRNFILKGKMRTTMARAKAVQPLLEKLITKVKNGTHHDRQLTSTYIVDKSALNKLIEDAATRLAKRTSGFTRIVKLEKRRGDGGIEVMLQYVDDVIIPEKTTPVTKRPKDQKMTTVNKSKQKKSRIFKKKA